MTQSIEICDVGPRDGLQNQKRIWSVSERIELIDRLSQTGLRRIEAVSFVNPQRVPQMADAEKVMAGISRRPGCKFSGLALNARGIDRAIDCGVDEVRFVVVASETFSRRNQGVGVAETLAQLENMADRVRNAKLRLSVTVAAAFGCPFEGAVPVGAVTTIARRLSAMEVDEIGLADTIGSGVPSQVKQIFFEVRNVTGEAIRLGGHFHNTRNTGYANAVAAIDAGALFLDSSIGGMGGCPFAPQATGNIATEDLCFMLRNMSIATGVDPADLIEVAKWTQTVMGEDLPGQLMKAGLFPEIAARATS